MIQIRSLHKFFNKGKQNEIHVIDNINLELPERGMVAIFGKSGCGKTTLLNVIGGLDGFGSGALTIEGQDIRQNTDDLRNRYIGYIFQNYNLNKAESCFENVANALRLCGMTDEVEIETRVMAALANVGMDKYSKRTPDTLSGGQQQRIAIARAIVKNPRIILADEPTGNLDEANTVMIMDLLKQIAKDHLVLLVTHEANLVDFYCDTVVELHDGKVVNIKSNASANGFAARDKNTIYLGELEKTHLYDENAAIEYYGNSPNEPIRLKIVNNGGKLYVQINTPAVQVLDEFSEIKLCEGVFEQKAAQNAQSAGIDMSKLPPVEGTRFGRLFSLKSSLKSGYVSNFKNYKKGKKILRGCMCLFAAVLVFMSAVFGTSFADIINAKNSYNHNVFYVYTPDGEVSEKLNAAATNGDVGVDYVRLTSNYPTGDSTVKFMTGFFETFSASSYDESFQTNAVYLDVTLAKDLKQAAGSKENLDIEEILITTAVADALLEKSSLGYITEYSDLIGLISNSLSVDGKNLRIAGVVESDESAIYLTELAMAKYVMRSKSQVRLASDFGLEVAPGEAVLAIVYYSDSSITCPQAGDTVKIQGRDIKVSRVVEACTDYDQWLQRNNIEKQSEYAYLRDIVLQENPGIKEKSEEFSRLYDQALNERLWEYWDYYYSENEAFLRDSYLLQPNNIELWMALEKDVEAAKYVHLPEQYFKAIQYKKMYGKYPTDAELEVAYAQLPYVNESLEVYYKTYEMEFYSQNYSYVNGLAYLVNESDYIAFSRQLGESHPSLTIYDMDAVIPESGEMVVSYVSSYVAVDMVTTSGMYTVIHSNDPERTQAWLQDEFSDLAPEYPSMRAILTPDDIFDDLIANQAKEIIAGLITMAVVLVIMSICMYFIMRSSIMNRIKEVGIYRAIGVSKKNLLFKFLIEAVVLTTLTVFIGYCISSLFIFACMGISSQATSIFFYPSWLAIAVLGILYALCLFCGTLPIMSLLRKTPSEILAKYDI